MPGFSPSFLQDGAHHYRRDLALDVESASVESRRVPAVISTEYPVTREDYLEVLAHSPGAVDLSRAPLPLIEQHDSRRLNIGIVENIRLDNGVMRGDVVFGNSDRANEIWPDVLAGIVRNLSVAYLVIRHQVTGSVVRVTRWQPFEVSLVSVPADPGAGIFRSLQVPNPSENPNRESAGAGNDAAIQQQERTRILEIRSISTQYLRGVSGCDSIEERAITSGMTSAAYRTQVIDHLAMLDEQAGGHLNRRSADLLGRPFESGVTGSDDFVQAASDALLLRSGVRLAAQHPAARDFRGMSLLEMARASIRRGGRAMSGESPQAAFRAAMSTSDFPALLGDALAKSLRNGAEAEQATHRVWCSITAAADFRTQNRVILGSAPDLKEVKELGEYTNGPLLDDKTTLVPVKFGRIISLSWESMLADNLGGFLSLGRSLGQAAIRAEADALYGDLVSNALAGPTLADTKALFAAERNNTVSVATGTGKPLTAAALGAARAKLRRQVNLGGGLLNLAPRTLIVPPERETEAEILVASSTIHRGQASADAATPAWIGGLTVVAEPRLTDVDTFYLVADQDFIGTGELAVVDDSPHIEEIDEPKRDVSSWKVRHAFAAGFVDFRGIVRATLTA